MGGKFTENVCSQITAKEVIYGKGIKFLPTKCIIRTYINWPSLVKHSYLVVIVRDHAGDEFDIFLVKFHFTMTAQQQYGKLIKFHLNCLFGQKGTSNHLGIMYLAHIFLYNSHHAQVIKHVNSRVWTKFTSIRHITFLFCIF